MAHRSPEIRHESLNRLRTYRYRAVPPALRRASVMVLLAPGEEGLEVLLTQRAQHLSSHPGEVSLPGGNVEAVDVDLYATALRETREETGLQETPEYIGQLDSLYAKSGIDVAAFVSVLPEKPVLQACADEVADMFWVPLETLAMKEPEYQWFERRGEQWPVPFFYVNGWTVWGMTGMVMVNLINVLTGSRWLSFHDHWASNTMNTD